MADTLSDADPAAALTAALSLIGLPGIAGSAAPPRVEAIPDAAFHDLALDLLGQSEVVDVHYPAASLGELEKDGGLARRGHARDEGVHHREAFRS